MTVATSDPTGVIAAATPTPPVSPPPPSPPPIPLPPPAYDPTGAPSLTFLIYDRHNNLLEDVTTITLDKQVTLRLNRPATARGRMPTFLSSNLAAGNRCLRVYQDSTLIFNGIVWFIDDDGDENTMYTDFIAVDPMIWLRFRYARDDDGDFSDPYFFRELIEGPTIMRHLIDNTLQYDDIDDPFASTTGIEIGITTTGGTFETGGPSMAGAPANYPMTIADAMKLMTDTGALDVVMTYVDESAGHSDNIMAVMSAFNGNYGNDLSGSSVWDFATGSRNVRHIKRTLDMGTIGNASRLYLGPKQDIQHWFYEIDATNPELPNLAFIQALVVASRGTYGKFMDLHIYDSMENESAVRGLYLNLFELEMLMRCTPREIIDITPVRGLAPDFGLGDIISFNAGGIARGGFSGQMRVYEYTVAEDNDGVFEISKIVASADQESDA